MYMMGEGVKFSRIRVIGLAVQNVPADETEEVRQINRVEIAFDAL
jgi:hypothetical protein